MTPHVEKSKKYWHCISGRQVTGGEWGLRDYWEQTRGLKQDYDPETSSQIVLLRVLRNPSPEHAMTPLW